MAAAFDRGFAARLAHAPRRIARSIVEAVPQLARGQVWCHRCGYTMQVNSGRCLGSGWPKHCGETMSIDSPEERAALARRGVV